MKKQTKARKKNIAAKKSAAKRSNKIVITTVIIGIITILALTIPAVYNSYLYDGFTEINPEENYEEILFENAKYGDESSKVIMDESIRLKYIELCTLETGEDYYHFELVNYDPQGFLIGENKGDDIEYENVHEVTTLKDFSKRHNLMIESAREKVVKFIEDSTVLADKENLIERIKNVPIYQYKSSEHEKLNIDSAPAIHVGSAIYCNYKYREFFCEHMFVHELIHHLRYLTMGEKLSNLTYYATKFDEGVTDVIAVSMNPRSLDSINYANGYEELHPLIHEYFNVFGEEALRAYFYGYDAFFASMTPSFKTEHEAFVVAFEKYLEIMEGMAACEALVNYWAK